MSKARIGLIAVGLIALVVAGVLVLVQDGHEKERPGSTPLVLATSEMTLPSLNTDGVEIRGASPSERALLKELLNKVPADEIKTISFEHNKQRGKRALVFAGPNTTRAEWEQEVLGGLFVLRARQTGIETVPIADLVTVGSAGSPDLTEIDEAPANKDILKSAIVKALDRSGARLVRLRDFDPLGSLPALIVKTPDPASFAKHSLRPLRSLLSGFGEREGSYVLVFDNDNRRVLEEAFANRLGMGSTYEPASFQTCDPDIPQSLKARMKFSPCPAK